MLKKLNVKKIKNLFSAFKKCDFDLISNKANFLIKMKNELKLNMIPKYTSLNDSESISSSKENDYSKDRVHSLQESLLEMGFELRMINAVISHFNIQTKEEAIFYLVKTDGQYNHQFIPRDTANQLSDNTTPTRNFMKTALSRFNSSNSQNVCEICLEPIESHRIKSNTNLNSNEMNAKNKIYIENQKDDTCQICLSELTNPVVIENCRHKFCRECFYEYLRSKIIINDIDNIACPNSQCYNKKLSEEFFFRYLDDELILKYRTFKSQNEIARDPNKIFCPFCGSYAEIPKEKPINKDIDEVDQNTKKIYYCIKNNHKFCSCGRPIHDGLCYRPEKEFKSFLQTEKIKKCPKCGFLIKKDRGCNHMTCGNPSCKFEFCWLCMKECFPDHFNFGPCSGLQFVDEDSIVMKIRNYPGLYKTYIIFKCIFLLVELILCLICPTFFFLRILFLSFYDFQISLSFTRFPRFQKLVYYLSFSCIIIAFTPVYYFILLWFLGGLALWCSFKILKCSFFSICASSNRSNSNLRIENQEISININHDSGV